MIEAKRILTKMSTDAGPDGMKLGTALIHGYAAIGRGVRGAECISYLADLTQAGILRIEHDSWIYHNTHGRRIVAGGLGDRIIPGIARMGELIHASRGYCEIDRHELAEKIAFSAIRVQRELAWRKRLSGLSVSESNVLTLQR